MYVYISLIIFNEIYIYLIIYDEISTHFSAGKQTWVFGAQDEATQVCIFWTVPRRGAVNLTPIIKHHIKDGSTIKSDQWKAYSRLSQVGSFFHYYYSLLLFSLSLFL